MLTVPNAIVSCQWLQEHIHDDCLVVLNASIPKATAQKEVFKKEERSIPSTRFFDLKGVFSDQDAEFPNTMVSAQKFEEEAQKLGISQDSCVVVYDEHGIYSSPRAWYMFKAMGFDNIAVLDGGLPKWKSLGFETIQPSEANITKGNVKSKPRQKQFVDVQYVLNSLRDQQELLLDARSFGRFQGTTPEPRIGVRSGHIPSAKSLPYAHLLDGHSFKNKETIQKLFKELNPENKPMVFSCGTGITACVLALGAEIAGYKDSVVYDGSWTEWGSLLDLPIEV
jgi:thiosulfate/3-mercaptopyruvate sulfurtransferase